ARLTHLAPEVARSVPSGAPKPVVSKLVPTPSPAPSVDTIEGRTRLRRGQTAQVLDERRPGWEYRAFALGLIAVMADPPTVQAPAMPIGLVDAQAVVDWIGTELQVTQQFVGTLKRLMNHDLQAAAGPPGQPGDPDAILDVVWNTGRQAAGARAWAAAVRATRLPYRFIALRDELARTVEQPLRELAAFGPGALASIDQELRAQHDGPPRVVNLTLTFALENQQAFEQALEAALRESAMSNERAAILAILRARVSLLEREHSRR